MPSYDTTVKLTHDQLREVLCSIDPVVETYTTGIASRKLYVPEILRHYVQSMFLNPENYTAAQIEFVRNHYRYLVDHGTVDILR